VISNLDLQLQALDLNSIKNLPGQDDIGGYSPPQHIKPYQSAVKKSPPKSTQVTDYSPRDDQKKPLLKPVETEPAGEESPNLRKTTKPPPPFKQDENDPKNAYAYYLQVSFEPIFSLYIISKRRLRSSLHLMMKSNLNKQENQLIIARKRMLSIVNSSSTSQRKS